MVVSPVIIPRVTKAVFALAKNVNNGTPMPTIPANPNSTFFNNAGCFAALAFFCFFFVSVIYFRYWIFQKYSHSLNYFVLEYGKYRKYLCLRFLTQTLHHIENAEYLFLACALHY
jgi:hypothetical protein